MTEPVKGAPMWKRVIASILDFFTAFFAFGMAIGYATGRPHARIRLGTALDALFAHEEDEALRALMIRRTSERSEPASARALARWLGHLHGAERRRTERGRQGHEDNPRA